MTKLGFLCGSLGWGGLEMNQLKNARWFQEKGYSVFVLSKEGAPITEEAKKLGLPIILIPPHRRYKYFFAGLAFKRMIQEHQLSHIIVRDSKDLNICSIAKTFSRQKFHLSYFMEMQIGVSKRNFLHSARYKKIDVWVCPLHYLKEQVLRFTRFPENKIQVIPSALEFQETKLSKSEIRAKYGIPEQLFLAGVVGRIDPHKGQLKVLHAIHQLNHPKIALCLVGSPTIGETDHYFEEIKAYIQSNQLDQKVFIIPHQQEVFELYKAFDVTIMSSRSETFGMVTIESLANGIPVIGTNTGGTPEILQEGKFGLLYEANDIKTLQKHLVSLYKNELHFDANELIKYSKNFDYQRIIERVEMVLGLLKK
jgi:glycosyltransferase involved in cell wall biosynthesis